MQPFSIPETPQSIPIKSPLPDSLSPSTTLLIQTKSKKSFNNSVLSILSITQILNPQSPILNPQSSIPNLQVQLCSSLYTSPIPSNLIKKPSSIPSNAHSINPTSLFTPQSKPIAHFHTSHASLNLDNV